MDNAERVHPFAALRVDLARAFEPGWSSARKLRRALSTPEIWSIVLYRLGTWVYLDSPRAIRPLARLLWRPWSFWTGLLTDTHLGAITSIGPGLYINHHGGIWINENARLGSFCNVGQGVVIGTAGGGVDATHAPRIGDRVWIGPHAVITGPVRVGNDVVIGANSLVVSDVPDHAVVVGVPARVLSYSGSSRLIRPQEIRQARRKVESGDLESSLETAAVASVAQAKRVSRSGRG